MYYFAIWSHLSYLIEKAVLKVRLLSVNPVSVREQYLSGNTMAIPMVTPGKPLPVSTARAKEESNNLMQAGLN